MTPLELLLWALVIGISAVIVAILVGIAFYIWRLITRDANK